MDHKKLKEMQNLQYEILKNIDQVCRKNNIKYFLAYGTLLGGVRHKASIPWDDDIDIAMTRDEYNKFKAVSSQLKEEYFLSDVCYSDIKYASLSRVIMNSEIGGIHVDIFILDYAKEKIKSVRGALGRFLQIAKLDKNEKNILYKHFKNHKGKLIIVHIADILRIVFGSEVIEKWNYNWLISDKVTSNYIIIEQPEKLLPIQWFAKSEAIQYEDGMYPAPIGGIELLKTWYGNYMEIPPEGIKFLKEENELIDVMNERTY